MIDSRNSIFIGNFGGSMEIDGLNPISLQILVKHGNRMWLEPHYFDKTLKPIGNIKTIVPEKPDDPNSLIDACLAFAPKYFQECPSLEEVKQSLKGAEFLDFDIGKEKIPHSFDSKKKGRY